MHRTTFLSVGVGGRGGGTFLPCPSLTCRGLGEFGIVQVPWQLVSVMRWSRSQRELVKRVKHTSPRFASLPPGCAWVEPSRCRGGCCGCCSYLRAGRITASLSYAPESSSGWHSGGQWAAAAAAAAAAADAAAAAAAAAGKSPKGREGIQCR